MEYKGKLYGKVNKSYFPLEATTEDFEALEKRVAELEAENKALRQPPVSGQLLNDILFCFDFASGIMDDSERKDRINDFISNYR